MIIVLCFANAMEVGQGLHAVTFVCVCVLSRIEPRASRMLGKHYITKLYPQPDMFQDTLELFYVLKVKWPG